jgi:hypothetical protein
VPLHPTEEAHRREGAARLEVPHPPALEAFHVGGRGWHLLHSSGTARTRARRRAVLHHRLLARRGLRSPAPAELRDRRGNQRRCRLTKTNMIELIKHQPHH